MGIKLVGRNIVNEVSAETEVCPPHIPRYPHSLRRKDGKAKNLSKQVFGTVVNSSNCSLNQVFGLAGWQSKYLESGFWFGGLAK